VTPENSPTQKKMSDYARAIAAATKQLIEAAHYVQQNTSKEDENRPDWGKEFSKNFLLYV
jgi:hypothetical protein